MFELFDYKLTIFTPLAFEDFSVNFILNICMKRPLHKPYI